MILFLIETICSDPSSELVLCSINKNYHQNTPYYLEFCIHSKSLILIQLMEGCTPVYFDSVNGGMHTCLQLALFLIGE